jgi:predicted nucleic acid-binding Zn ribbon protein
MSLKSIHNILGILEIQERWQEPPLQRVLKCWYEVVGKALIKHTKPVWIQRDVLQVATSSAAMAQNLTFERQRLLEKLNQRLPTPLTDIHFSTANWYKSPLPKENIIIALPSEHPSYVGEKLKISRSQVSVAKNINEAYGKWAEIVKARSHDLSLCPKCQCPTPPGELQRWGVCSFCAAKQMHNGANNR